MVPKPARLSVLPLSPASAIWPTKTGGRHFGAPTMRWSPTRYLFEMAQAEFPAPAAGWRTGALLGKTKRGLSLSGRQRMLSFLLIDSPLNLTMALNLDGGPVACQGISLNGYERKTYGRFELEVQNNQAQLIT